MHIHFHILIHYIRHARLLASHMRYLGTMLLMLFFGLLQLAVAGPVLAAPDAKNGRDFAVGFFSHDRAAGILGNSGTAADHVSPDAIHQDAAAGVFNRLKPRIVMIPRMNRTPKPKSVYRCFTRAPGA